MSTFVKRATPRQRRVYRIVEGAVRNAAHAHPEYRIPALFAKSVAKRAAGTLTAAWPSVLAAKIPTPSGRSADQFRTSPATPGAQLRPRRASRLTGATGGACAVSIGRRTPAVRLRRLIGMMVGSAKRAGETARAEALIEVLKLIHREFGP